MKNPTIDSILKEFKEKFVRGASERSLPNGDVQEADEWVAAEVGEIKYWLKESLSTFEQAVREETARAYGGCEFCFGKGYATYRYGISGAEDFDGEGFQTPITNHMQYCSCDRGRQLKELVEENKKD